jgi:hypothetical protein
MGQPVRSHFNEWIRTPEGPKQKRSKCGFRRELRKVDGYVFRRKGLLDAEVATREISI